MNKNEITGLYKQKLKTLRDSFVIELEKLKAIILDKKSTKNDIKKAVEKAESLILKFKWIVTEIELKIAKIIEKQSMEKDEEFLTKLDKILSEY